MIQIQPFENQYKDQVVDLILTIQQKEFQVPITINEQQDLLDIPNFYQQNHGNFWLALYEGKVIGSIALIDCGENVGAIRKMFVKKEFRGKEYGIAQKLLDLLTTEAQKAGMTNLYLGTLERLQAAIRFYIRNGFEAIEKQNIPSVFPFMPVDTHFFEKNIQINPQEIMENNVQIIEYQQAYKDDFKRINVEWIETFFKVEPHDLEQLEAPDEIIANGGQIFLAKLGDEIVGTSALIHDGDGIYELAKMGVTPKAQGLGLGKKLCVKTIDEAKARKAKGLYLLSNTALKPAISIYKSIGFVEVPLGKTFYERTDIKMDYPL